MINRLKLDLNESVVSLNDVKQLYVSMQRRLLKWAMYAALAAFLGFGSLEVQYKAEATFKEEPEQRVSENILKELLGGISVANQPHASSFMRSHQVLLPVVEKTGLQITPSISKISILRLIRNQYESWQASLGYFLKDLDLVVFEDVLYSQEKPFHFKLLFLDAEHFSIHDQKKKEIGRGIVGQPVHLQKDQIHFTVTAIPKNVKIHSYYTFDVSPWLASVKELQESIEIFNCKENNAIIEISLRNRNRHLAVFVINEIMRQYQIYLKKEYDHIAKEQLAYLESKQGQIYQNIEHLFDEHSAHLSRNLDENGFLGVEREGENLLVPYQTMQQKVVNIDLELSREGKGSKEFNAITQKIRDLKQQRDLIELSLCQSANPSFSVRKNELKEIREQRFTAEKWMREIDRGTEISSLDLNQGLILGAKGLFDSQEKEDLTNYLENYSRLLSMREKMVQERFFYGASVPSELEGIDLVSAKKLFMDYNTKLDHAEEAMRHYAQVKREISNPYFDLASLTSVLKDPFCLKLIDTASNLNVKLKDEKHHSAKEIERWKQEIALHRQILSDHLDQLYQVEELNLGLVREKMGGLQRLMLDCLNRQISVLHEQTSDAIKEKRQILSVEKKILEHKMEEMRKIFSAVLPEKWRYEKWLELKTTMGEQMIKAVTEVVESKTISTHLHHIVSKPLDSAIPPTIPSPTHLHLLTCLSAFFAPFLLFSFKLVRQILKGFPMSLEKFKALQLPVLGTLSAFCDGPAVETPSGPDLDVLRNIAFFSERGKVIGLLVGNGPDYSYALGENLARLKDQIVIVRCDFLSSFRKEEASGILQMWKGEISEPTIYKLKGFDLISTGGYTPYGAEVLQSQIFKQLIELLQKKYSYIYLFLRGSLTCIESLVALRLCDKAIVTVTAETTEELTPLIHWGYDEKYNRLTFITQT